MGQHSETILALLFLFATHHLPLVDRSLKMWTLIIGAFADQGLVLAEMGSVMSRDFRVGFQKSMTTKRRMGSSLKLPFGHRRLNGVVRRRRAHVIGVQKV